MGEWVPGVLRGMAPRRGVLAKVRRAWAAAAGPEIAKKTRVEAFDRGVLTVAVASSAVKHHLGTFMLEELLEGLEQHLDQTQVRTIRFKVGEPT